MNFYSYALGALEVTALQSHYRVSYKTFPTKICILLEYREESIISLSFLKQKYALLPKSSFLIPISDLFTYLNNDFVFHVISEFSRQVTIRLSNFLDPPEEDEGMIQLYLKSIASGLIR